MTTATRLQTAIDVTDLRVAYGAYEAVRGVSFSVGPGELFALLGTNGAGKTTTMETLEGHRDATAGDVRVLGLDPRDDRQAVRPRVGIMLQESGFAGDLTTIETVRLWDRLRSPTDDPDRLLQLLDLGARRDVQVKQLSGGERRRLDLALALHGRPEVLFLDEPTTGLDPESRQHVWSVVRGLLDEGVTVLLTTHYLEEAEQLADRLAIMHAGRIALSGAVRDVVAERPSTIAFGLDAAPGSLPSLEGAVELDHDAQPTVRVRTHALQRDLTTLLGWAEREGVTLHALRAQQATLDEVFREVTEGRHAAAVTTDLEVSNR